MTSTTRARQVDRAVGLYTGGATTRQVAAKLRVDEYTIRRWLRDTDVAPRPPGRRPTPELPPKAERARSRRQAIYHDTVGPLPARRRRQIIRLLERGYLPVDAAQKMGISVQRLWGASRLLPEFRAELDQAIACIAGDSCGTRSGYREHGCRCVDCRRGQHPRPVDLLA